MNALEQTILHTPAVQLRKSKPRSSGLFLLLLCAWGLINIVQGMLTQLNYDEAYYWMYSRHLAWGYFDQPPMIALFIALSNLFFQHEIGVRIISILAQMVTLFFLWKLIEIKAPTAKKVLLFFGIAASVVMFEVYGFIATPDSPLLLFTTLFLFSYKRFLKQEDITNTILLALSMAGMLYSKYQGGLFILFIILSNLQLLKSKFFWTAGMVALLLFLPHLLWQYQHDFPSFTYQLVSRSRPFEWKHVLSYWPNQFFSFNPFFLGLVIFILISFRPSDKFERGLYFTIIGFLAFFFVATLKGRVEPHWTISVSIGMIYMAYKYCIQNKPLEKFVTSFLLPTLLILFILRVALIVPFLPVNLKFHGEKAWAEKLYSIAGKRPVVFHNTYQKASMYTFYTGQPASSMNSIDYRSNQFDIWNLEESLYGKEVMLVTQANDPYSTRYKFPNGKNVYLHPVQQFFSANKLEIHFIEPMPKSITTGDTLALKVELHNPYTYEVKMNDRVFPIYLKGLFIKNANDRTTSPIEIIPSLEGIPAKATIPLTLKFVVPDICADHYRAGIVLQQGLIQELIISDVKKVMVYEKPHL